MRSIALLFSLALIHVTCRNYRILPPNSKNIYIYIRISNTLHVYIDQVSSSSCPGRKHTRTHTIFRMEIINRVYQNVYETFAEIDPKHALRLIVIVGGYIFLRNIAQRELAKRQLQNHVKEGEKAKQENQLKELVDDPNDPAIANDNSFGWGKRTRQRVKRQEKILEEKFRELQESQGFQDDDRDIEDLLED